MISLLNCDCMEYMAKLATNSFDIGIVDLEWGIGASRPNKKPDRKRDSRGDVIHIKTKQYDKDWDAKPATKEYGDLLFSITRHQIIWGANFFPWLPALEGDSTFKPPRRREYDRFLEKYPRGWIIWDKVNGNCDQFDCELAWTSFDQPTIKLEYMWNGAWQGKSIKEGTVQQGNKALNEIRIHPTQKPVVLYKWLLGNYVKSGWKVLDTHLGSYSIAIACHDLGIDLVGCEKDLQHYSDGLKRYEDHSSQIKLF